jgi:UDP-glucuronate 4-epimerase
MQRDFTYIDDIVEGIIRVSNSVAAPNPHWNGDQPDPGTSKAPYRIYNIGNHNPVQLMHLIEVIENCLGRKANKRFLPMQPGDVPATFADVSDLTRDAGFQPSTSIEDGVRRFVDWYLDYYQVRRSQPKSGRRFVTAPIEEVLSTR